ncbi:Conserved DNA-binding protein YbaB [Williamsia sterculiae]|uniref:Conserved DNA-binding protein YbaB n=1 Tax=Williamsia sterculiae TaxID=1344003 RepID=A0A1N7GVF4_9NOCA|nr:Conserved DNA-binding protein YbaB [Williamsia sterculiae]
MVPSNRWDDMFAAVQAQRAELHRVSEIMQAATAEATSTDRLVGVTVDARGRLVDLRIDPLAARRHRADVLSTMIVELVAQADDAMQQRRDELIAATEELRPSWEDVR